MVVFDDWHSARFFLDSFAFANRLTFWGTQECHCSSKALSGVCGQGTEAVDNVLGFKHATFVLFESA